MAPPKYLGNLAVHVCTWLFQVFKFHNQYSSKVFVCFHFLLNVKSCWVFLLHKICSCHLAISSTNESTIFFDESNLWFEDFRGVEHDLETCSRPWSTWILALWPSQGPKSYKWSTKNIVLSSLHPCTKIAERHGQVY